MFRMCFREIEMRTRMDRSQIQALLQSVHFMIHSVPRCVFNSTVSWGNTVKWYYYINLQHFVLDLSLGSCPEKFPTTFLRKFTPLFELLAVSCHGGAGKTAKLPYLARLVSGFTFYSQRTGTSYNLPLPVPELTNSTDV